jgi:hypothetical protein
VLFRSNILTGLAIANVPPSKTLEIMNALNWWMAKMFPATIVACVVIVGISAFRITRVRTGNVALLRAPSVTIP